MTPDPIAIVAAVLHDRGVADVEDAYAHATLALRQLLDEGLDIVRFASDVDATPGRGVTVERWPGDNSHLSWEIRFRLLARDLSAILARRDETAVQYPLCLTSGEVNRLDLHLTDSRGRS